MAKYHNPNSCNKCSKENQVTVTDSLEYHMLECKTKCKSCGFEDYWAHGFYESGQEIESKCKTYSFESDINSEQ